MSGSKKEIRSCKKQIGRITTWQSKEKKGGERYFFLANSDCEKKTRVARKKQGKRSWQRSWGPTETRKKWRGCTLEGKTEKKLATRRCPAKKWRGCEVGGEREQVVSAMAQGASHTWGRNVGETFSWCLKLDGSRSAGVRVNGMR